MRQSVITKQKEEERVMVMQEYICTFKRPQL